MAAFLSGLMGALRGVGGGIAKGGAGLMGALDPAVTAAQSGSASDLGDFRFGPGLAVEGLRPEEAPPAPAKPGFFQRINTADPKTGLTTVDKWDRLGATLRDFDDDGDRASAVDKRAAGRLAQSDQAALAAQIDQLFPDDPRMQFLLKANPEKATEAMAAVYQKQNEPANVSAGDTRVFGDPSRGGSTFMAPKYGEADGYGYRIGPDGFQWGDQRGPTHGEVETGRHNRAGEAIDRDQVDVSRGNLGVARGNLSVSRDRLNFDREKERGPGGSGGLGGMSTEDLIAALRGAR